MYYYDSDEVPQPSQSSLNVPLCESPTITFSFAKVPYVTTGTFPKISFGQINLYQYSLPTGWKLGSGSPVSGPTDYQVGTNSENVTPDFVNGNSGYVKIRGINNCGDYLTYGPWKEIPVTRLAPNPGFSVQAVVCGSATFAATSVPTWATGVLWQITTPSNAFTLSNPTSSSTTITPIGDVEGEISFTIYNTNCPAAPFTFNTQSIIGQAKLVGNKPPVPSTLPPYYGPGDETDLCRFTENYIPFKTGTYSTPTWSYVSHVGSPQPSWNGGTEDLYVYFFRNQQVSLVLQMDVTNTCGTNTYQYGFKAVDCFARAAQSFDYVISPNPSNGQIQIAKNPSLTIDKKESDLRITNVAIYNTQNNLLFSKKYESVPNASINLSNLRSGNYFVRVTSKSGVETQQIIIK